MTVDMARLTALAGQLRQKQTRPPTAGRKPWRIVNATSESEATVYLYDDIGEDMWGDGVSAEDFANDLDAITAPTINVRFNSQGGQVFAGVAMYEAIKRHPSNTIAWIDSLAASAASFIAMACDTVVMGKRGRMMIHDAGIGGIYIQGNARQVREAVKEVEEFADLLDSLSDTIAQIYVDKAGGTVESWRAEMATDRWYTAEEAVAAGLADYIDALPPTDKTPEDHSGRTTEATTRWNPQDFSEFLKGAYA